MIERNMQAVKDVSPRLSLRQIIARAAGNHLLAVMNVVLKNRLQRQYPWLAIDQRQHIRAEGRLHGSIFEELVQDRNVPGVAAQINHHANALAVGLITY